MRPWALFAILAAPAVVAAAHCLPDTAFAGEPRPKTESVADRLRRLGRLAALQESRAEHAKRQWEHVASTDGEQCREALAKTGAKFRPLPDRAKPDSNGCGIPHGVILTKGPTGITYSGPLMIDCSLALTLPAVEKVIQEEAVKHLGSPIVKITTLGSYSCRSVRGWKERISQHALGNAMDLASFSPKSGLPASVQRDYVTFGEEPKTPRGHFIRAVYRRLWSEAGVTRVLGPDWDASHRDHFHLDRGLRFW